MTGAAPVWRAALFEAKRVKASDDPELFATYRTLIAETSYVAAAWADPKVVDEFQAVCNLLLWGLLH